MAWVLGMAVLAIPFFAYEGTVLQYNVKQHFGFDPITGIMILLVFAPFTYFVLKR